MIRLLSIAILGAFAGSSLAAESEDAKVREAILSLVPNATIDSVSEAVLPGFYEVILGSTVVYVSADGKYLIQGSLYDIQGKHDLTEGARAKLRVDGLKSAGEDKRIVFAPANPKHTVTVFTDIDCGYCRRLHQQIPEYNQLGISIEYLFYPRAGIGSESFDKAVSVWCSDDRREALTTAKNGGALDKKDCANPIKEEYELGGKIGVSGTPMIIAADGTQLGGYVAPAELLQRLDQLAASAKAPAAPK